MSADEVFCFRAHTMSAVLAQMHEEFVAEYGPDRVFVIADHTAAHVDWPARFNVIEMSTGSLDALGLYRDMPKTGWRCGDYCYYSAREAVAFDRMWLIESDVYFHLRSLRDFFDGYQDVTADFLGLRIRRRDPSWDWYPQMAALGFEEVYGCHFPLTRVSRPAVDVLLQRRQELSKSFTSGMGKAYPNDESYVVTTLVKEGRSFDSLEGPRPELFEFFHFGKKYCLPDLLAQLTEDRIIHSALAPDDFYEHARHRFRRLFALNPRFASTISEYTDHLSPATSSELTEVIVDELRRRLSLT